jgi:Arc/MetJ-type ribon-helix-helix transcriptional regulator
MCEGEWRPHRRRWRSTLVLLALTLEFMGVRLTPDQEAFIRQAIASGRFQQEEALQEALALWEERERNRAEVLAAFDEAESDLEADRFADYTDASLPQLAEELKREARTSRAGRSHG